MLINKDTKVCISIAKNPGNFGATIFNSLFKELSLNYIYKPFKVEAKDLKGAMLGIKSLGIRGCGVSMPHKVTVLKFLDKIDDTASTIGAVNTIVNNYGIITGYNTDYEAAKILSKNDYNISGKDVLIAGAGGVSRAIIKALKANRAKNIFISSRNEKHGQKLAQEFDIEFVRWTNLNSLKGNLLINATPVGMDSKGRSFYKQETIERFEAIFDVVIQREDTDLIKTAKALNKYIISGIRMAQLQAMIQFKLYTGINVPIKLIEKIVANFIKG